MLLTHGTHIYYDHNNFKNHVIVGFIHINFVCVSALEGMECLVHHIEPITATVDILILPFA
jgi:hypothetical protein